MDDACSFTNLNNYCVPNYPASAHARLPSIKFGWVTWTSFPLRKGKEGVRALNSDITANGGSGFIRWRANESREWKFALSPSHFSDGNNRANRSGIGSRRQPQLPV